MHRAEWDEYGHWFYSIKLPLNQINRHLCHTEASIIRTIGFAFMSTTLKVADIKRIFTSRFHPRTS